MNCPMCGSEMQAGTLSIAMSNAGAAVSIVSGLAGGAVSLMPQFLYFRPSANESPPILVSELDRAFRCSTCLTVVMAGEELAAGRTPKPEDEAAAKTFIDEIDALLAQDQAPAATRRFRQLTCKSWDKALDTIEMWGQLPAEHKMAMIVGAIVKAGSGNVGAT